MADAPTLKTVRRWIREGIDRDYYDKLYTLQLFAAGDYEAMRAGLAEGAYAVAWTPVAGNDQLPSYPEILTRLGPEGVQNHGIVNARIAVQSLSMDPEFTFVHDEPVVRQFNSAFIRDRWTHGNWRSAFYMTGLEAEICGIGLSMCGVSNKRVDWRHVPILDVIWDRAHKEPAKWQWACTRNRLTPEDAQKAYPCLTKQDIQDLIMPDDRRQLGGTGTVESNRRIPIDIIQEWSFYTKDYHVVFLGKSSKMAIKVLALDDESGEYRSINDTEETAIGKNPFGCLPYAFWVDSWSPGINRPVAKTETTMRIAKMLNEVEQCMMEYVRSTPITAINTQKIDSKLNDEILKSNSFEGLRRVVAINGGSIKDVVDRLPPVDIPQSLVVMRNVLKEEMDAASGISDMQRGQALSGEKTKFEVQTLTDQSGVQARHLHRTFGEFACKVVEVTREIASEFDETKNVLQLETVGSIDMKVYPPKPFLTEPMPVQIDPDSLIFRTEADRKQEGMVLFTNWVMPLLPTGVLDPRKVLAVFGKKFGFKDALKELGADPPVMQPGQSPLGNPTSGPPMPGTGGVPPQAPPLQQAPGTMPMGGPPPIMQATPTKPVHMGA